MDRRWSLMGAFISTRAKGRMKWFGASTCPTIDTSLGVGMVGGVKAVILLLGV
jgi:hypothetical protein